MLFLILCSFLPFMVKSQFQTDFVVQLQFYNKSINCTTKDANITATATYPDTVCVNEDSNLFEKFMIMGSNQIQYYYDCENERCEDTETKNCSFTMLNNKQCFLRNERWWIISIEYNENDDYLIPPPPDYALLFIILIVIFGIGFAVCVTVWLVILIWYLKFTADGGSIKFVYQQISGAKEENMLESIETGRSTKSIDQL